MDLHPACYQYWSADVHPPFLRLSQRCCTTGCSNLALSSATGHKPRQTTLLQPCMATLESTRIHLQRKPLTTTSFPLLSWEPSPLLATSCTWLTLPLQRELNYGSPTGKMTPHQNTNQCSCTTKAHSLLSACPPLYSLPPHLHPSNRAQLTPH